jgi:hypothetical protein
MSGLSSNVHLSYGDDDDGLTRRAKRPRKSIAKAAKEAEAKARSSVTGMAGKYL